MPIVFEAIFSSSSASESTSPTMSDYVKASLNSAKSLLHALRSRPSFTDVSSSERARIQTVLASSPLTTEKLADIAGMINQIGFADIDDRLLLDFIGGLCMQPSGGMVQPGYIGGTCIRVQFFFRRSTVFRLAKTSMFSSCLC